MRRPLACRMQMECFGAGPRYPFTRRRRTAVTRTAPTANATNPSRRIWPDVTAGHGQERGFGRGLLPHGRGGGGGGGGCPTVTLAVAVAVMSFGNPLRVVVHGDGVHERVGVGVQHRPRRGDRAGPAGRQGRGAVAVSRPRGSSASSRSPVSVSSIVPLTRPGESSELVLVTTIVQVSSAPTSTGSGVQLLVTSTRRLEEGRGGTGRRRVGQRRQRGRRTTE